MGIPYQTKPNTNINILNFICDQHKIYDHFHFFESGSEVCLLGSEKPYKNYHISHFWLNNHIYLKLSKNKLIILTIGVFYFMCYQDMCFICSGVSFTIKLTTEPAVYMCDKSPQKMYNGTYHISYLGHKWNFKYLYLWLVGLVWYGMVCPYVTPIMPFFSKSARRLISTKPDSEPYW